MPDARLWVVVDRFTVRMVDARVSLKKNVCVYAHEDDDLLALQGPLGVQLRKGLFDGGKGKGLNRGETHQHRDGGGPARFGQYTKQMYARTAM